MTLRSLKTFAQGALALLPLLCLAGSVTSSLRVHPHSLAYFNEAAGGPENGHKHMLGSNLDWGQDLLALERWADESKCTVSLAYHGTYNPRHIFGRFLAAPDGPFRLGTTRTSTIQQGDCLAVSVNYVHGDRLYLPGRPYSHYQARGDFVPIGYSLRVFSSCGTNGTLIPIFLNEASSFAK